MIDADPPPVDGSEFEHQQMVEFAEMAFNQLGSRYLGDEADLLKDRIGFTISEEDSGHVVPVTSYDPRNQSMEIIIDAQSIRAFAEDVVDDVDHEISTADIAKVMIGAGIARCIVGWKATQSHLVEEPERQAYKEKLCSKANLWEAAAVFDEDSDDQEPISVIRPMVERLGDAQIMRINMLRYAFGASLNYMFDSLEQQQSIVLHMRKMLIDAELQRRANLDYNLAWLTPASAFAVYDEEVPELELAFSFPMSPGEEQQSFAA